MGRTTARAAAMQLVYERLLGGQGGGETLCLVYEQLGEGKENEPSPEDQKYIDEVLSGISEHQQEIDGQIEEFSVDWSLARMAKVDLTILRVATYEILFREDVPGSVAINEAVELAGKYSDPAGSRFINGVLGSILRKKEAGLKK
jgi:N utilization substance protein B